MDIEALSLLANQKRAVQNLWKSSDQNFEFEEYEERARDVISSTERVIREVSKYAEDIFNELQAVREGVNLCSIKISEKLKELMNNLLLIDALDIDVTHDVYITDTITRQDIDMKKVEQAQKLQRLAKQQQELMELMAKTEDMVLKLEEGSKFTLTDLKGITNSLQQWTDALESVEEKKRRLQREKEEEEQKKKEEEERKKREEERRKREKEQEEREKEEKRKRQEEEKRKRDWNNWPPFIFNNTRRNKFKQDLCCVVFTMPNGISREDIVCQGSDANEDLDTCLERNDEQVISSVITITPQKNKKITFQLPIRVHIPIVDHDAKLEPILKFSIDGKPWKHGRNLPEIHLPSVMNVAFVGVEIPIKQLTHVRCVAVASYRKDITEVDEEGKTFEPQGDRNIKVNIPAKAFPGKTTVTSQSIPWTKTDISNATKQHKELQNIKTAGTFVDISCENVTKQDSELHMYDFGWIIDKKIQKHHSVHQETIYRSSRWLVNNMNPELDTNLLDEVFDSDFLEQLESNVSTGDKNRMILRELHDSSDSDFDKFVKNLESTQPQVASRIKAVQAQVALSRRSDESYTEDDFGNDFDPDFEKKEGSLRVVSKFSGKSWEIVELNGSETHPKARLIKLPTGHDKYQFLGLVVSDDMPDEDICKAAEVLESLHGVTNVSLICRQQHTNLHDVIIELTPSENISDTIKHLDELGYNKGPAESSPFGVVDGEEIVIKFEGNLYLEEYKRSPLKMKFYRNLPNNRFSGHVAVLKKAEQWDTDQYHGYLTFGVSPGRISMPRKGSMVLYVQKPMEELIGKFAYTLDVPVKALAKFIAWQLTRENPNSTKWVKLGGYLTDCDSSTYHQITKHIDSERPKADQRDRCENFIIHWSIFYARTVPDKIEKIIASHHDPSLESEAQQFIRAYTSGTGIFSNDTLEKIAYAISEDWEVFARKLGCNSDEINHIKSMHGFKVKQGLQMLDWWRLSDQAIQKGVDLVKSFHDSAKSAKLGAKLLTLVTTHM